MAWQIRRTEEFEKTKKAFETKWHAETEAVLVNLRTLVQSVEMGASVSQLLNLGFVRPEPMDLLAIDETGCQKKTKPRAIRLYVYVDYRVEEICVLLFGGKDRREQSEHIAMCKEYVKDRLKRYEQENKENKKNTKQS